MTRFGAAAWMLLLAACSDRSPAATARPDRPSSLEGTWHLVLTLDSAPLLQPTPTSRTREGHIRFVQHPDASLDTMATGLGYTYAGPYALDLRPFGIPLTGRPLSDSTPNQCNPRDQDFAVAWPRQPDSVYVRIRPCVGHGGLDFAGRWIGDSAVGTWYYGSSRGGSGRFIMRAAR